MRWTGGCAPVAPVALVGRLGAAEGRWAAGEGVAERGAAVGPLGPVCRAVVPGISPPDVGAGPTPPTERCTGGSWSLGPRCSGAGADADVGVAGLPDRGTARWTGAAGASVPEGPEVAEEPAEESGAGSWCAAVVRRTGACGGVAAPADEDGEGDGDGEGAAASPVGRGALVPAFAPEAGAVDRDAARCTGGAGVAGVEAGVAGAAGAPGAGEDGGRAGPDSGRREGGSPAVPLFVGPGWAAERRTGAPEAGAPPRVGLVPSPGRFRAGPRPGRGCATDRWTGVPEAGEPGEVVGRCAGGVAGEAGAGGVPTPESCAVRCTVVGADVPPSWAGAAGRRVAGVPDEGAAGVPVPVPEACALRCAVPREAVSPSRAGAAGGWAGPAGVESGAGGVPVPESRVARCTGGRGGVARSGAGAAAVRGAGSDGGTEDDRRAGGVAAGPSPLAPEARRTGVPAGAVAPSAGVAPGRVAARCTGGAVGESPAAEARPCGRTARCTGAPGAGAEAGAGACAGAGVEGVADDGEAGCGVRSARAAGEAPPAGAEPGSARSPSDDEEAVPDGPGAEPVVRRLAGRARRCTAGVPDGALVSACRGLGAAGGTGVTRTPRAAWAGVPAGAGDAAGPAARDRWTGGVAAADADGAVEGAGRVGGAGVARVAAGGADGVRAGEAAPPRVRAAPDDAPRVPGEVAGADCRAPCAAGPPRAPGTCPVGAAVAEVSA
ncbi:hypothetical protein [Streptomyces parvulus]|uniref:hypothetical protein n=1 Tax=Streptomyces parvulus TaxID=146923 RepID=UPI0036A7D87E